MKPKRAKTRTVAPEPAEPGETNLYNITIDYKVFRCIICGFEYHESHGLPEESIPAGTRWDDIPDDWFCPDCGTRKQDFRMVEIKS